MLKVVYDTNILVSGFYNNKGKPCKTIKLAIANEIRAYASIETFKEFSEVIRRPYFKLEQNEIDEIESLLLKVLNFVGPRKKVEIIKDDASDNKFIECALEAKADYIITGDKHLLTLKEYENIKIVTASEFLEIWQKWKGYIVEELFLDHPQGLLWL